LLGGSFCFFPPPPLQFFPSLPPRLNCFIRTPSERPPLSRVFFSLFICRLRTSPSLFPPLFFFTHVFFPLAHLVRKQLVCVPVPSHFLFFDYQLPFPPNFHPSLFPAYNTYSAFFFTPSICNLVPPPLLPVFFWPRYTSPPGLFPP